MLGIGFWAPKERGVYIWQTDTESLRALGTRSDIAYIGGPVDLARRLRYHALQGLGLQVTWRPCWSHAEPEQLEDQLLRLYRRIHGQFPPYNRINAARRRPVRVRRSPARSYASA
jgi:hypothetical protein